MGWLGVPVQSYLKCPFGDSLVSPGCVENPLPSYKLHQDGGTPSTRRHFERIQQNWSPHNLGCPEDFRSPCRDISGYESVGGRPKGLDRNRL